MDSKSILLQMIEQRGGFINTHAHLDRAFTLSPDRLHLIHNPLEQKWLHNSNLKRMSSVEDYKRRIERGVQLMRDQHVHTCITFVDIDPISEFRALDAACQVRDEYADTIKLLIANQTIVPFFNQEERIDQRVLEVFEHALHKLDIIGGLPAIENVHNPQPFGQNHPCFEKHIDILFDAAKKTGKPVHVHVDQKNHPGETETAILARKVLEYGLKRQVAAIHAVSLGAQLQKEREKVYEIMRDAGLAVIVCPSAELSMEALPYQAPIHNSIAPVKDLWDANIPVSLGTDNIMDIYCPLIDGDLYTELRLLAEACRFYDFEALARIATQPVPGMREW
jgi:cytosine/adenosine deaminase-related metal-dependent hydrolase